jgi:transcriptional regulator with XRE-family HTH domain
VAERLAVAISTVQRLEAGGAARLSTVAKLAEVLGVTPADLMTPLPTQTIQVHGAAEPQADYQTDSDAFT